MKTTMVSESELDSPQKRKGPYVHLHQSFHLQGEVKFDYTYNDDDSSLGSSVQSGLRNSLHSSYDFGELDINESLSEVGSFGDDDEIPSWRLDPEESESDWTLVVESVPDGEIREYHVHTWVLTEGFKKSDYFVSFFSLSANEKVENEGFSEAKIHVDAACLVPDMLDYLYSVHDLLKITSETAVGLRHLSEFFGIRALAKQVQSFIFRDMSIDNMRTYLLSSVAFDDLQTQKLCAKRCAENIMAIGADSELLVEMDPSFLLDILSSHEGNRRSCSAHMSKLVSVYCELHRDIIDGAVFEELTTVEYLPIIGLDCAIDLMILEADMVKDARNEHRGLTYLQKRCVETLVPHIQYQVGVDLKERTARAKQLKLLPKKVLAEILAESLCL